MPSTHRILALFVGLAVLVFGACSSSKAPPKVTPEPISAPVQEEPSPISLAEPPPPKMDFPAAAEEKAEILDTISEESLAQEREDGAALLEDALSTFQDALAAWERGDSDSALQALDEAYGLILKAQLPPDSPLCQEKNDLRLLIAQRIQQIYAARLVTAGDNHRTIPLAENPDVLREIASFQGKERRYFEEGYMRSGLYREMILEELRKEGLPEELSWMPLIESWFKVKALSKARALGMWQFISSTGYRFGLERDRWIDERLDPLKSTQAAVKYLIELHSFFGDWTTAMAAYNCGEIRVQNVIRTQRIDYLDNFWDLYRQLPVETARYVPRLIAALLIINNPEKYGFNLPQPYPSQRFETITVKRPFKLAALATSIGADAAELAFLNPELRYESTPNYEYAIRVPVGTGEKALLAANQLPNWIPPEAQYVWHYVRSGETLSTIAKRYRTTVSAIARLNNLRSVHFIKPRQRLKIPGRGVVSSSASRSQSSPTRTTETVAYKVRQGDTPIGIARRFSMPLEEFLLLNGLTAEAKIYPGQEVKVAPRN
jgi:membrane-bound lytic murein transglycosylase D